MRALSCRSARIAARWTRIELMNASCKVWELSPSDWDMILIMSSSPVFSTCAITLAASLLARSSARDICGVSGRSARRFGQATRDVAFHTVDHRVHVRLLEEVARALHLLMGDRDALLLVQFADQRARVGGRGNPVVRAVDDQTRCRAGREEAEVIAVCGGRYRDEAGNLRAAHQKLHPDPRPEAEPSDPAMLGVRVHCLKVVEGRGGVRQLADALIVFTLTAPDAAKIEPQHGEAKVEEGIMQIVDDPVVHCPAELRVRMQNDRDRCILQFLRVIAAFEAAFGAGEDHFGHWRSIRSVLGPVGRSLLTQGWGGMSATNSSEVG